MAKARNLDSRLKVMRKRRGRSLHRKIVEYAGLFNLDITIVARDKINGEYEIFQPTRDINFPPAMKDIVSPMNGPTIRLSLRTVIGTNNLTHWSKRESEHRFRSFSPTGAGPYGEVGQAFQST